MESNETSWKKNIKGEKKKKKAKSVVEWELELIDALLAGMVDVGAGGQKITYN